MNIKKILATVSCAVIVGLALPMIKSNDEPIISCDYKGFSSLAEMEDSSNLIVDAIVVCDNGSTLIDVGCGDMKYKTYDLKITRCIKGNVEINDVIPLKILETAYDNIMLEPDKEYIFFMETYDNGIPASLINMDQASISINDNNFTLSSIQRNTIGKDLLKTKKVNYANATESLSDNNYISKDELINIIQRLSY